MDYTEWLSNLCISELKFAKTYTMSRKVYPIRNKSRHHHGFIFTTEGTETYTFRDKKISSPPGTVLYIPKGEAYTIELSDETNTVITMEFEIDSESEMRPFLVKCGKGNDIKNCFVEPLVGFINNEVVVINMPLTDEDLFIEELLNKIQTTTIKLDSETIDKCAVLINRYAADCSTEI